MIVSLAVSTLDTSYANQNALYSGSIILSPRDILYGHVSRGNWYFSQASRLKRQNGELFYSRVSMYGTKEGPIYQDISIIHPSRNGPCTTTRWGGQVTWELVLLQSEESLGLNRALDHIRERVLNIIYGNHSNTHIHFCTYIYREGEGEKKRKIHFHYSLSTLPVWNCFAYTTSVNFCHRNVHII